MTLQDLDAAFRARVAKDKKLAEIRRKIAAGKATFKDTAAYSERISNLLGETLSGHIEQIPASERAKICEWLLRNQYADTNETLAAVQRALDEADGIRLAPQKPPFPAKRVNKVSGALEDVTASMDVIRRRANGPVANVSKSFHDDYIKRNAEFRSKAGLPCYIVREAASGCCKWCTEIAGRYECNGDLPEDVYRRHDNCSCTTTYENGRMRQDVWSKRQWEAPEPDAGAEPPTVFTEENRPAGFQPKVLTGGEKVIEQSKKALQNAADSGIMESELGRFKDRLRTDKTMTPDYYSAVKEKFSHGSKSAKQAFNVFVPYDSVADSEFIGIPHYDPKTKKIFMNYSADISGVRGSCATWFHEHGHLIDDAAGKISHDELFRKALSEDYMGYMQRYGRKHGLKTFDKVQSAIGKDLDDMRKHSGISDIFHGVSKGNIQGCSGHPLWYWDEPDNLPQEAFAHMFECQFDETRYREMKEHFPKSLARFEEILEGAVNQ